MGRITIATLVTVALYICSYVKHVEGGECCRSYVDNAGIYHYQQWCPVYCCGYATLGKLECCSNPRLRAFEGNRDGFCASWFTYSANVWAPIIIGFIILMIIIACCVCCIRCCFFI